MKVITPRGRKPIMIEDHAHSEPWRNKIKFEIWKQCPLERFPGAVTVEASFVFAQTGPSAQQLCWPVLNAGVNASGDLDKLTRNLLDAMQESRMIVDDCMVVRLDVKKMWANDLYEPGMFVVVRDVWG